jgi:flagellar biosynthesis GTPase FlhF
MAETVSLAVLENLVHMAREDFPVGYVAVAAVVPDEISVLKEEALIEPSSRADPRTLGDFWIDSCASAVVEVRSTII